MADNDVSFRQCAVIEFPVKGEIPAADIHHRLQRVYGDVCMGASSVRRWVKHFKDGNTSIQDQPRSGRSRTASTEPNKKRVDVGCIVVQSAYRGDITYRTPDAWTMVHALTLAEGTVNIDFNLLHEAETCFRSQ